MIVRATKGVANIVVLLPRDIGSLSAFSGDDVCRPGNKLDAMVAPKGVQRPTGRRTR